MPDKPKRGGGTIKQQPGRDAAGKLERSRALRAFSLSSNYDITVDAANNPGKRDLDGLAAAGKRIAGKPGDYTTKPGGTVMNKKRK